MILDWILGGAQLAASMKAYSLAKEQWEAQKRQQEENYKYQLEVWEAQREGYQQERVLRHANAEYLRETANINVTLGEDDLRIAHVDAIRFRARGQQAQLRGAAALERAGRGAQAFIGTQEAAQGASGISVGSASAIAVREATRAGFREEAEDIAVATQDEIYASAVLAMQRTHEGTRARFGKLLAAKDLRRQALNELATGARAPIKPKAPITAPGPSPLPYLVSGFQGLYSAFRNSQVGMAA